MRDRLPRRDVPDDGVRCVARRREQPPVVAERERDDGAERAAQVGEDGLVAEAPERYAARRGRGREEHSVRADRDGRRRVRRGCVLAFAADRIRVEAEWPAEPALAEQVPGDHAAVARTRDECVPVRAEERRECDACVADEPFAQPSGRDVPDADAPVVGACSEHLAVAAERETEHAAGRATLRRADSACPEVDELDGAVVAAERRGVVVRRERGGTAHVEGANPLERPPVEQIGRRRAARYEQLPAPREADQATARDRPRPPQHMSVRRRARDDDLGRWRAPTRDRLAAHDGLAVGRERDVRGCGARRRSRRAEAMRARVDQGELGLQPIVRLVADGERAAVRAQRQRRARAGRSRRSRRARRSPRSGA